MTSKEAVSIYWKKLKEEMVQQMDFQIKNYGKILYTDVNKLYKSKLKRWSGNMQPEGRWLEAQTDENKKKEMLEKLENLYLEEATVTQNNSNFSVVAGVGAVGVSGIAGVFLDWSMPVTLAVSVIAFAGTFGHLNNKSKKNENNQMNQLKEAYVNQIVEHGEQIAQIWEE